MIINTDNLISISEVNQNFSRVVKMVAEKGAAVILKNNAPKYLVIEFNKIENKETEKDSEKVLDRIIKRGRKAYKDIVK